MAKKQRLYQAIVLNDYELTPYASWVKEGKKKIETRNNRLFKYRGDIVICCGKSNSVGPNAGKALCVVDMWKGRKMIKEDEDAACIEYSEKRRSLLLRNWRHFSRDFEFAKQRISGPFQGIFTISIPDDVLIIPRP